METPLAKKKIFFIFEKFVYDGKGDLTKNHAPTLF